MATPYIGEIKMLGCNFAPKSYAFCNGQLLSIAQNQALFSILGTTYGGNGQTTFGLPNLQGRAPMHFGNGAGLSPHILGEVAGTENVTLLSTQLPLHNHSVSCVDANADQYGPAGNTWAKEVTGLNFYGAGPGSSPMSAAATSLTGSNQPHNNMQPALVINFCIALFGVFPSRN